MISEQFDNLVKYCKNFGCDEPEMTGLSDGGVLIVVPGVEVEGWNRPTANLLFVAPPGYPAGQPDCFWVEPNGFRLADGGTPQSSNDGSAIPNDISPSRSTTWFSWHVQTWDPSRDTLITYFKVILDRLHPAR